VVSTANVSQLAADLLITSLSLKRVALVDPKYFIPAVGGRDDGEAGVTVPLERMCTLRKLTLVVVSMISSKYIATKT
jgi:proteasome assembly chaperone 2